MKINYDDKRIFILVGKRNDISRPFENSRNVHRYAIGRNTKSPRIIPSISKTVL